MAGLVQDPSGHTAVEGLFHMADAAAVHQHPRAPQPGRPDGKQVIIQRPAGGAVLDQAAAAVDEQLGVTGSPQKARHIKGIDGPDAVQQAGLLRLSSHDGQRDQRVDGAHGGDDGPQNGLVPRIALAVGTADQHLPPPGCLLQMQDAFVDPALGLGHAVQRIQGRGFFIQRCGKALPLVAVQTQLQNVPRKGFHILRTEDIAVFPGVDQAAHAAYIGGDDRAVFPDAL